MATSGVPNPRVLVAARNVPWPVRGGSDLRTRQTVNALANLGTVGVFALHPQIAGDQAAPGVAKVRSSNVPNLADTPRIGSAALEWVRAPHGHPSDRWYSSEAAKELAMTVAELEADVVVVEHLWLHRYFEPLADLGCHLVLNAHNVESAVLAGMAARAEPRGAQGRLVSLLAERTRIVEGDAVRRVDQVWVCSERDAELMRGYEGCAPVVVVPNTVDVPSYSGTSAGQDAATVLYPGQFGYPPNAEAATFLIDDVMPLLWGVRPDATLVLVGQEPTPAMVSAAARDPRIVVTGPVPDAKPYIEAASVMAVPLAEGGGTRFKVLEAFASRVPVVSTRKGTEGLEVEAEEHFLPAETPGQFVDQLVRLWDPKGPRDALAERAHALVSARYSWDVAADRIGRALRDLLPDRTTAVREQ